MKRRRRKLPTHGIQPSSVRSEINVTPLVDVVLVLLIIFMVVTPMLSRGVKVELPEAHHHEKTQDTGQQILVTVDSEERVFLESTPMTDEQLAPAVKRAIEERQRTGRTQEIHVRGDKSLTYGQVRRVLERVHEAGARSVALATDEARKKD